MARNFCLLLVTCGLISLLQLAAGSMEYNRYLAHIFRKYGNGSSMSFEGLEHLMYNLGLGHIEFDPTHTIEAHHFKRNRAEENESALESYFEQQTMKFLPKDADEDDMQEKYLLNKAEAIPTNAARRADVIYEFKEMHDPKHRHPRENDESFYKHTFSSRDCLSPKSLLRLVIDHDDLHKRKAYKTFSPSLSAQDMERHNVEEEYNEFVNAVKLSPVSFMKLCPALLAQIDQQVCVEPAPLFHAEDPKKMLWNAWLYASCSIFILSACGLLGILLVPLMKTAAYQEILKFLIAVAMSTLSGDALMHLLPHALGAEPEETKKEVGGREKHSHSHNTMPIWLCATAFAAATFMYVLENLLPLLKGDSDEHGHGHSHGGHGHGHDQLQQVANKKANDTALPAEPSDLKEVKEINIMLNELKKDKKTPSRPLTPVAFMVVIGDGLHNLTDGLAIGAAFASDPVTGMATAFAVLCHELPHELGDFALLLQTGVSIKRAIVLNIVSSVLSFLGMAIGLLVTGLHAGMTQWIYAATAGSFLYIAFAVLVPTMGLDANRNLKTILIQIAGILAGFMIMLAIALHEEELEGIFK